MKNILSCCSLLFLLSSCSGTGSLSTSDTLSPIDEGIIQSSQFGLMWQMERSENFSIPEDAKEYAETLLLGGYTDWRLPTRAEFHNLYFSLDFGPASPKEFGMKMEGAFWTQADDGELKAGEWDAGETCCIVRTFVENKSGRVRAVRP